MDNTDILDTTNGPGDVPLPKRKSRPYRDEELEVILSLVPTRDNIRRLSKTLNRSEGAIKLVYRIAYVDGKFAQKKRPQVDKIIEAKKRLSIVIGPLRPKR